MTVRLFRDARRRTVTTGGVLLLALGTVLIPGGRAGSTAQAATAPQLKVVTFNTCGQSSCQPTVATATDWAAAIQRSVAAYDPDVINLQELCDGQGKALPAALPNYTFHWLRTESLSSGQKGCLKWGGDGTIFGAGQLVKTAEAPTFHDQVLQAAAPLSVEPRPLICAEANLGGQPYQACNVHLDGGVGGFKEQGLPIVINRMQYWGGQGRPTVLAGDFNADPADPSLGLLYSAQDGNGSFTEAEQANRAYFTPACRQLASCRSGEMTTFPDANSPKGRKFDYIFSSSADFTTAQSDTVLVTDSSGNDITPNDHKMYRATLNLTHDATAPSAPQVFDNPATISSGNEWANAVDRTAGDLNGDGVADLVLRYANGTVMSYPGLGNGRFGTGQQLVGSANGWYDAASVTAGYFNGDGLNDNKADLLVRWNVGSVFLYPNDGTGKLGNSIPLLPANSWSKALDVTTGHVLGGPNSDVVIRWSDGSITASPVNRAADGTYSVGSPVPLMPAGFAVPSAVVDLTTGDFNGDGKADLLVRGVDGSVTLYTGNGGGSFAQPGVRITDGRNWSGFTNQPTFSWKAVEDITAGDFTKDGKDDVVIHWMNQYQGSAVPGRGQTEFLPSTGTTTGTTPALFGAPTTLKGASPGAWTTTSDVLVADVNGDGKSDLITRQTPGATILNLGNGNGSFQSNQEIGGAGSHFFDWGTTPTVDNWATSLTVGNFTSSSSLSLLARSKATGAAGVYPISTQTLTAPTGVPGISGADWTNALDVVAGHFYGGPLSDLVIRYSDGSVMLYRNTGGAFASPDVIRHGDSTGWSDAATITAGDFNGDGKDDLLVRWHSGSAFLYPGTGNSAAGSNTFDSSTAVQVNAAGDLSDVMDVAQGTVYGTAQGAKMIYHWADGSLLIDGNGTADLTNPVAATVNGPDARFTLRASDDRGRVASFEYTLDGAAPVSLDAFHNTLDIQLHTLTAGAHQLSVVAVDPAGNRSAATAYGFTVA